MRHKEPDFVLEWREKKKVKDLKCCHTCYFYNENGVCRIFGESPPESFANEEDACEQWESEIPF